MDGQDDGAPAVGHPGGKIIIKSGSATGVHNWDMTVVDIAVTVSVIALVTPPGCATVPVFTTH